MIETNAAYPAETCGPGPEPDDYFVPEGYALAWEYMQREKCPEYIEYELMPRCIGVSSPETHCEWAEDVLPLGLTVWYDCVEGECVRVDDEFSPELQGGYVVAEGCEPPL